MKIFLKRLYRIHVSIKAILCMFQINNFCRIEFSRIIIKMGITMTFWEAIRLAAKWKSTFLRKPKLEKKLKMKSKKTSF
jgi:hypothetical protein